VILITSSRMPTHTILDNLDFKNEHLMLKCMMREQVDTSHLSTELMPKIEALKLFDKTQVLLDHSGLEDERKHLLKVLANGWHRILGKQGEDRAGKLTKFLPRYHRHVLPSMEQLAAIFFISKIYPCQETRHSHMI
jgi:hypothetical protein